MKVRLFMTILELYDCSRHNRCMMKRGGAGFYARQGWSGVGGIIMVMEV